MTVNIKAESNKIDENFITPCNVRNEIIEDLITPHYVKYEIIEDLITPYIP